MTNKINYLTVVAVTEDAQPKKPRWVGGVTVDVWETKQAMEDAAVIAGNLLYRAADLDNEPNYVLRSNVLLTDPAAVVIATLRVVQGDDVLRVGDRVGISAFAVLEAVAAHPSTHLAAMRGNLSVIHKRGYTGVVDEIDGERVFVRFPAHPEEHMASFELWFARELLVKAELGVQ